MSFAIGGRVAVSSLVVWQARGEAGGETKGESSPLFFKGLSPFPGLGAHRASCGKCGAKRG